MCSGKLTPTDINKRGTPNEKSSDYNFTIGSERSVCISLRIVENYIMVFVTFVEACFKLRHFCWFVNCLVEKFCGFDV